MGKLDATTLGDEVVVTGFWDLNLLWYVQKSIASSTRMLLQAEHDCETGTPITPRRQVVPIKASRVQTNTF